MTRWAERWVPAIDAPLYEVSDRGRVRRVSTQRVLRPAPNDCGYLKVSLGLGGGPVRQMYVHRLVILSHVGPPAGQPADDVWTVDHIDFDLANNQLDNLRWLTLEENSARHAPEVLEAWWGRQHHRPWKVA